MPSHYSAQAIRDRLVCDRSTFRRLHRQYPQLFGDDLLQEMEAYFANEIAEAKEAMRQEQSFIFRQQWRSA